MSIEVGEHGFAGAQLAEFAGWVMDQAQPKRFAGVSDKRKRLAITPLEIKKIVLIYKGVTELSH
jgi:hypothetical protein